MNLSIVVASYIERFTDYLTANFSFLFDGISVAVSSVAEPLAIALSYTNPWVFIGIIGLVCLVAGGLVFSLFSVLGLVVILVLNLWAPAMLTLSLVLTSVFFSLLIGIPLGALIAESRRLRKFSEPVLDFMQTMPSFVLLVPAVLFFGVGNVPAVVATIFFAMPMPIRFTSNGLNAVDSEAVEAGHSLGATRLQILFLIKFPLAYKSIMAGVNQCTMMCLAMVIVASMIGAGGLGDEIIRSISRLQIGKGIQAGVAVVILAILIDRLTKKLSFSK